MLASVYGGMLLLAAGCCMSGLNVFCHVTKQHGWPTFALLAEGYLVAALVFGLVTLCRKRSIDRGALPWLALRSIAGCLAVILTWAAIYSGTSPGTASAIESTQLAMAAILGKLLLGEELHGLQICAIGVAVIGAALVAVTQGTNSFQSSPFIGVLLALAAAACKASSFVISRRLKNTSSSHIAFGVSLCASPGCFLLHLMVEPCGSSTASLLEGLSIVAACSSMLLLLIILNAAGSKRTSAAISTSVFTSAFIVSSYAANIFALGMLPSWSTLCGVIMLLIAVFVLCWAQSAQMKMRNDEKIKLEATDNEAGEIRTAGTCDEEPTSAPDSMQCQLREGDLALADYINRKHPGTRFVDVGSRWGHLIVPGTQQCGQAGNSMRVVLFTSSDPGKVLVEAVKAYGSKFPGSVELVGVVTDHAVDPDAKISLKKRFWKFATPPLRLLHESVLVESVISAGVEVYTGEIKTDSFRKILERWRPDVIISCIFGQLVDVQIINVPPQGIYNFHPSDLQNGMGAGTSPWEDMERFGTSRTVWSVHQMTEGIDEGQVIGQSPEIEVGDANGVIPQSRMLFVEYVAKRLSWTASRFLSGLVKRHDAGLNGPLKKLKLDGPQPQQLLESMLDPVHDEDLALTPNRRLQMLTSFDYAALETPGWLVTECPR